MSVDLAVTGIKKQSQKRYRQRMFGQPALLLKYFCIFLGARYRCDVELLGG